MSTSITTRLESQALSGQSVAKTSLADDSGWVVLGLRLVLDAMESVRRSRYLDDSSSLKKDGSPSTPVEVQVERQIRETVAAVAPEVAIVGEEEGGSVALDGLTLVLDPIDGTWAFLTATESLAVSLVLLRDGHPLISVIGNPATQEVAYAWPGYTPRLLLVGLEGTGSDLPLSGADTSKLLVNCHPSRSAFDFQASLHRAWTDGIVRSVRSPGGSPSWALVEAAKGHYVYVNRWAKRPAEAHDLVAGVHLLRLAGGEALDMDGMPIRETDHAGPFVAGVGMDRLRTVIELLQAG